ncbi:branched-chain amino acid transport system II carrier protein [Trichococcus pasteurii]|uniref:Branched-chain amino acid transport system carrier protein n=1 Tax=Trichococcus pasteurii TaxID=43064 RepID=A0A1W1IF02_9LACT|nr:branched-chain amino acid transport system II carrier protein [Trichococcus pasteurii]SFE16876.1 branched-chain amino acid:cation transporter, LIVCS family [Trichococcus pasteurii]SLM51580.1 branched-chain amino acid transport system ii carrier protein [Trichococcus pasteurii]SSB92461.1 branched-chain amino acid transport system ii carrier protein [Trichococcus pasteurii]
MDKKLSNKEYIYIGSMLFGLFFGAGNLIFPVHMGQLAGQNLLPAILGFIVTAVGLPFLGIVAMGLSGKESLLEMASKVHPKYGVFFTAALYLTIGPFFATPRTATVSFEAAFAPYLDPSMTKMTLFLFSLLFFAAVLWFSLKPSEILKWVGKVLNPIFLVFLSILILFGFFAPMGTASEIPVDASYQTGAFFKGFLEGYNTMDALASLAFGIIVVTTIQGLGVTKTTTIAKDTIKSGTISMLLMAVIYGSLVYLGATSRGIFEISDNGGIALAQISNEYFGIFGAVLFAVIITVACLKTAIGLITAISETFVHMFPGSLDYKKYVYLFTAISFGLANLGLSQIIAFSIPVLMFLYPLSITLILLSIMSSQFNDRTIVYQMTTLFTLPFATVDFLKALPQGIKDAVGLNGVIAWTDSAIPLSDIGMGWLIPSLIGFAIGLAVSKYNKLA